MTHPEPFLSPRLVGERFDDHAVPLEFLKDLAVLEEFVIEVAKAEFLKVHSDRQRSPRGFTEGVSLKLATIEEGSAVPVIVLSIMTAATLFFTSDTQNYLERGRDAIIRAIFAAENNEPVTDILPEKTLGYFDRLGRSLQANESIEFTSSTIRTPARLTREIRRRLVLASSTVNEITDELTIRGTIPEADQGDMTFELQLIDGRKIKAPLAAEYMEAVLTAFNEFKIGTRVAIKGIGRFNRSDKLLRLDSIEHVTPLDTLDVSARLDELRQLKDGWLDGDGLAPKPLALDWLTHAFTTGYPEDLPLPHAYPTPEGNVRFEWSIGSVEVSLDIDMATKAAAWHQLDTQTDKDTEDSFDLSNAPGWQALSKRVQQLNGGAA